MFWGLTVSWVGFSLSFQDLSDFGWWFCGIASRSCAWRHCSLFEKWCPFHTSWLTEYLHLPLPKKNRQHPKHRVFHEMPAFFPKITPVNRSNPSLPKHATSILPKKDLPKGPVMLFVMTCRLRLGSMMQLHFFEPRYRYMCRHLTVGGRFGFMNGGRCSRGCTGVLCEVMEARLWRPDGCTCCAWFSPFLRAFFEYKCKFKMEPKWIWGWPLGKIIFKNLQVWVIMFARCPPFRYVHMFNMGMVALHEEAVKDLPRFHLHE